MNLGTLVVVCVGLVFAVAEGRQYRKRLWESTEIVVNDTNWFFSPLNWLPVTRAGRSCMQTSNPGAYFKVGFTGSSATLLLDERGTESQFHVRYSVDDAPALNCVVNGSSSSLPLTRAVHSLHSHSLFFIVRAQSGDRWHGPHSSLRVCGLAVDHGSHSVEFAGGIRSSLVLTYGDSIGEGVNAVHGHNDATVTWTAALAAALESEWSNGAWSAQGYTTRGAWQIPCFHWPGNASQTTWDKFDARHSRLTNGLMLPEPDYIFNGHGTNDFLHPQFPHPNVTERALDWLVAIRRAAPHAFVFLCVPFGGFRRADLTEAFSGYQAQAHDRRTFLLDIGRVAERGIAQPWTSSYESADGIHPRGWRSEQLGAMLAVAAVRAISDSTRHTAP